MRIDMAPHIGADFANFVKAIVCRDTGAGDLKRAVVVGINRGLRGAPALPLADGLFTLFDD